MKTKLFLVKERDQRKLRRRKAGAWLNINESDSTEFPRGQAGPIGELPGRGESRAERQDEESQGPGWAPGGHRQERGGSQLEELQGDQKVGRYENKGRATRQSLPGSC